MPARNKTSHANPILGFVLPALSEKSPINQEKGWSKENVPLMEEDNNKEYLSKLDMHLWQRWLMVSRAALRSILPGGQRVQTETQEVPSEYWETLFYCKSG